MVDWIILITVAAATSVAASLIGAGVILVLLEIDYRLRKHR